MPRNQQVETVEEEEMQAPEQDVSPVPEFVAEDEFAKPSSVSNEELAQHQPQAARPRSVKLAVAEGNPHGHGDHDFPPDTLTPSLPENRPVKDPGPWGSVEPLESDPALLAKVQDPFRERDPNYNKLNMVVVVDSYGNKVLAPS